MTPKSPAIEHYIAKLQSSNSTLPQSSLRLSTLYTLQTKSHKPSHHGISCMSLSGSPPLILIGKSFFNHPASAALIPATRTAVRQCEAAFEIVFACQICDCADPRAELLRFPIHVFYKHTAALEWHALTAVLDQSPTNVAILGTGAVPEMRVWIQDWARENRTRHSSRVAVSSIAPTHETTIIPSVRTNPCLGEEACAVSDE